MSELKLRPLKTGKRRHYKEAIVDFVLIAKIGRSDAAPLQEAGGSMDLG